MNYVRKINKYLLEHYPLIWNTRLLWMVGINIVVHLLFFILGYTSINNIEDLKSQFSLSNFYSNTSVVYYNVLISILTLLVWIVFYLRNNAFKHFYKLQKLALFKEFCIIIIIFFISTSQYLTFLEGIKIKVRQSFDWEEIDQDIKSFNRVGVFLVQEYEAYEIKNKKYPKPFPLKHAINNEKDKQTNVDTTRAYINHKGFNYQFYRLDKELIAKEKPLDYYTSYDFRYRIVEDVSDFKELIDPSLLNYSNSLYLFGQDSLDYERQLKSHEDILIKKDPSSIKKELQEFLDLSKKYEIEHNLKVETWFPLVDNFPNHSIEELIRKSDPKKNEYYNENYTIYKGDNEEYQTPIPYSKSLYADLQGLDNFFKNVFYSYYPTSEMGFLAFLIGFIFFFGLILFIFKTTNLKSLLLSIVSAIVVLVLIVLLMTYVNSYYSYPRKIPDPEYFVMIFITAMIIISAIISFLLRWKKLVTSVLFSLGLYAYPLFFLFNALLYISYQKFNQEIDYRSEFEIWFDASGYWAIIGLWVVGIFIYTILVKKLKARPQ